MAKSKMSVSLNPETLEQARQLVPTTSVSELLDVALSRLIEGELERRHIDGYRKLPVDDEFRALARFERRPEHDDVDWAALYGIRP